MDASPVDCDSLSSLHEAARVISLRIAVRSLQPLTCRPSKRANLLRYLRRVCLPSRCQAFVLDPAEVADALLEHGVLLVAEQEKVFLTELKVYLWEGAMG